MANPGQHFRLTFGRGLWEPALALALVCALTVVATPPAQAQTFTVLHAFTGGRDGRGPFSGLVLRGNNLYGVTYGGGTGGTCYLGCGTVFKLTKQGSTWLFTPLYEFHNAPDGNFPAGVVVGPDGALYGTTYGGGITGGNCILDVNGCGTVFRLRPPVAPFSSSRLVPFILALDCHVCASLSTGKYCRNAHLIQQSLFGG